VSPRSKVFQSFRGCFKYAEKQISFSHAWEFMQHSLAFNRFIVKNIAKQYPTLNQMLLVKNDTSSKS